MLVSQEEAQEIAAKVRVIVREAYDEVYGTKVPTVEVDENTYNSLREINEKRESHRRRRFRSAIVVLSVMAAALVVACIVGKLSP